MLYILVQVLHMKYYILIAEWMENEDVVKCFINLKPGCMFIYLTTISSHQENI